MQNEWLEQPLSSLCVYLNRGAAPAYTDTGGILVLNQKCVRDQRVDFTLARRTDSQRKPVAADRVVKPFDILVNSTGVGTLGRVAQVRTLPEMATVDSHVTLVRPDSQVIDPLYLGLAIRCFESEIEALGEGSTGQTELSRARLGTFLIPMPTSLEEQRAIAHILGTLDEKIELNRNQNDVLEEMASALFKAWFVDFDPVRAKMDGRWQRGQSMPGMPSYLYDIFPDSLVETELGELPEGWQHVPFGSLLESTIGGDWGKDLPEDDHNEVVSIIRGTDFPDVSSGGIGKVPTRYTTAKKLSSRKLQAGDIVLEVSGGSPTQPTGRSIHVSKATLDRFSNPVVCASFCRRFHPRNKELGTLAFMHLQNLYAAGGTWKYQNQSTGIANFQTTRFLESEMILMPSAALLEAFTGQVQPLLAKIAINENLALIKLRDTLLPKLISGEMRVPDAERFVGTAV